MNVPFDQLGFDGLLQEAADTNRQHRFDRQTFHLPETMDEGLPYFRNLIDQHHAAMIAADVDTVLAIREEARDLARKLNGGAPGILAGDEAPGYVLAAETAGPQGAVPLWGQTGTFEIACHGMRVRIELEGLFGIGSGFGFWPGFAAHAVDPDKPFLSATGDRSFLGIHAEPVAGRGPEEFTGDVIGTYVEQQLKGRLVAIAPQYQNSLEN